MSYDDITKDRTISSPLLSFPSFQRWSQYRRGRFHSLQKQNEWEHAQQSKNQFLFGGDFFFFFFFTPLNQLTFKIDYFILHLVLMKKIFVEIWHGKRYAEREMTRETNGNYFSIRLSGASNNYLFLYLLGILYIYI